MRKRLVLTLVLASVAISVAGYYETRPGRPPVRFETARVTRSDLVASVACTGTLEAVKTVEVATQANGVIRELKADFNSVVHKGDIIAELDSSAIDAQIAQARAALERARAEAEQGRVAQAYAARQLARAEALHGKAELDEADLETARVAAAQATADVEAAEGGIAQARAAVQADLLDLDHTIIRAPIGGVVIARNVEVGQTVVSSLQAQTLFEIAEDLSKVQLDAQVDESDVARVRPGDPVTFTVDAYPGDTFTGTVAQVRLNPNIDQNVVSYTAVVDVPNSSLKLRPGMTANVTMRVDMRANVLRVPAGALRFKPNDELFGLLHQNVPAEAHAGGAPGPAVAPSPRRPSAPSPTGLKPGSPTMSASRQVWMLRNGRLEAVPLRVGLSDGTYTEVVDGRLSDGDEVVTNAIVNTR